MAESFQVTAPVVNVDRHDGGLRPVVGVQTYQVLRARRDRPESSSGPGWTYNHAPMLAHWNGRFYLEYLSNPVSEHVPPGETLLVTSDDGARWSEPTVLFPRYVVPDGIYQNPSPFPLPPASYAVTHQRMGFYEAPDGRLLACAFYGICPHYNVNPNDGRGIGRVVREIKADGGFGDIYFIRYNRHAGWNEANTAYPFYREAADQGFVDACDALLSDRLVTMQWWEEDRSDDGFYTVAGERAPSVYRLPDGRTAAMWKFAKAAISADEGESWTEPQPVAGMITAGGKAWCQRTADGKYALVYNPTPNGATRWPLAVVTSDDGLTFTGMLAVEGEVPPRRYAGLLKDFGPSYVRGIETGEAGGDLWLAYSMNKEDIWVSRVPVPITGAVRGPLSDSFDDMDPGGVVRGWNIHRGLWAGAAVERLGGGNCLVLRDRDPYAQASAERVFPESRRVRVGFRLMTCGAAGGRLYVEVCGADGMPPVQLVLRGDGTLCRLDHGAPLPFFTGSPHAWIDVRIEIDVDRQRYVVAAGGEQIAAPFVVPVGAVERLVIRTGPRSREPTYETSMGQPDLPGADMPVDEAVFAVDRVSTGDHVLLEDGR